MKTILRGGDNRKYKIIRSRYSNLLRECTKINSIKGKKSVVIKEEAFDAFVQLVITDENIDKETRLLIGLLCSTGLRITEVLGLKVNQIDLDNNRIRAVHIQKKRTKGLKLDKPIHPAFINFLKDAIKHLEPEDTIVHVENRFIALRRLKKYLDMGCHDFRHSYINYFLSKNKKQGLDRITKIMGWSSLASSFSYCQNCDLDKELDNFFGETEEKMAA